MTINYGTSSSIVWLSCCLLTQAAIVSASTSTADGVFLPTLRGVLRPNTPPPARNLQDNVNLNPFLVSPIFLFACVLFAITILRYFLSSEYRGRIWASCGSPTRGPCAIQFFHGSPPPERSRGGRGGMLGRFGRQRRTSSLAREYGVDAVAVALPPNTIELSPMRVPLASYTQSSSNFLDRIPIARASFVDVEFETEASPDEPEREASPVMAEASPAVAEITSVGSDEESPVAHASMVDMGVTQPHARPSSTSI